MAKNIIYKFYNKLTSRWEEIHPVTKASNVYDSNGNTFQAHINDVAAGHLVATTMKNGITRLATEAETRLGEDETKVVTPRNMKNLFLENTYDITIAPMTYMNEVPGTLERQFSFSSKDLTNFLGNIILPGTRLYSTDKYALIAKSYNNSLNNFYLYNNFPDTAARVLINSFDKDFSGNFYYISSYYSSSDSFKVYKTADFINWESSSSTFPTSGRFSWLKDTFNNGNYLIGSNCSNSIYQKFTAKIYRSVNLDGSWTEVYNNGGLDCGFESPKGIDGIIYIPSLGTRDVYYNVVHPSYILRSSNNGLTWNKVLTQNSCTSFSINKAVNGYLYTFARKVASTGYLDDYYYYKSTTNGESWISITKEQWDEEYILPENTIPNDRQFGDGTSLLFQNTDTEDLTKGIYIQDINYNVIGKLSSNIIAPLVIHRPVKINDNEICYYHPDYMIRVRRKNNFIV